MRIQLMSDLHTEFWRITKEQLREQLLALLQPDIDVLVLAGDISTGRTNVLHVLNIFAEHVPNIVYVPGNHEFYGGLSLDGFNVGEHFVSKLPSNVHFLNPGIANINGQIFIGAALWTNFRNNPLSEITAGRYIQDFKRAKTSTKIMADIHKEHLAYIKHHAERYNNPIIVTHFLPAKECVSEKWRNVDIVTDSLNDYFANDLGAWISELSGGVWLFGHTHDAIDVTLGAVRCLSNPLGYPGERKDYKPLVIEV